MRHHDFNTPEPKLGYDHPVVLEVVSRYGLSITHEQLAEIIGRTPHALRQALQQAGEPWDTLKRGRHPIGWHVHYDPRDVAAVISGETGR